mmetsp:Transcript_12838/g.40998  ORF Transcript_12838/g.40998 Transcript_12838/m.40998 type:complete len:281 (+) Transcript_12838:1569-2411(+)
MAVGQVVPLGSLLLLVRLLVRLQLVRPKQRPCPGQSRLERPRQREAILLLSERRQAVLAACQRSSGQAQLGRVVCIVLPQPKAAAGRRRMGRRLWPRLVESEDVRLPPTVRLRRPNPVVEGRHKLLVAERARVDCLQLRRQSHVGALVLGGQSCASLRWASHLHSRQARWQRCDKGCRRRRVCAALLPRGRNETLAPKRDGQPGAAADHLHPLQCVGPDAPPLAHCVRRLCIRRRTVAPVRAFLLRLVRSARLDLSAPIVVLRTAVYVGGRVCAARRALL